MNVAAKSPSRSRAEWAADLVAFFQDCSSVPCRTVENTLLIFQHVGEHEGGGGGSCYGNFGVECRSISIELR